MKIAELFLTELEREEATCRRALEQVPEGKTDWKPHEKSMPLGYLTTMIATMPGWAALIVTQDELDLNPPSGEGQKRPDLRTNKELLDALDESLAKAREALTSTTEEHLQTPWRFLHSGRVISENPRYLMIQESVFNHLAHHRGQLTVYLRLLGAKVPSIYGPTADEPDF